MSKIIHCLKILSISKTYLELVKELNISRLELLELIGMINEIEPGLINANELSCIYITREVDWLNNNELDTLFLHNKLPLVPITILDEVNSTNSFVLENIAKFTTKSVITTEYQSQGRGRSDKRWISKIATDITVSIVYWFDVNTAFDVLPLVMAVAINRLFKDFKIQTKIKWPNDIYSADGNKIGGILIESKIHNKERCLVIGIGIDNIAMLSRNILLFSLLKHVDNVISEFMIFGFSLLRQEWLDNCIHYNKPIKILQNNIVIDTGINTGVNANGALLVSSDNKTIEYHSTNISLAYN